jgi:hypothetical protein
VAPLHAIQPTFARGELSPRLHSRFDLEHWKMGLAECVNFLIMKQGGLRRRPGTEWINYARDLGYKVRLKEFVFSAEQAYVLEFGHKYVRFYANGGIVHKRYEDSVGLTLGTPGIVTWRRHRLLEGDPIIFQTTGTLPTGIVAGRTYYVKHDTVETTVTVNLNDPITVTHTAHGLSNDDEVYFRVDGSTPFPVPEGIEDDLIYYAKVIDANTYRIMDRPGGNLQMDEGADEVAEAGYASSAAVAVSYSAFTKSRDTFQITTKKNGNNAVAFTGSESGTHEALCPEELTTPWSIHHVWELQFAQSADMMFIAHPDFAPRTITRNSGSDFELGYYEYTYGPFLSDNTTSTTLRPSARTGNVTVTASSRRGINGNQGFKASDVGRLIGIRMKVKDKENSSVEMFTLQITDVISTRKVEADVIGRIDGLTGSEETALSGNDVWDAAHKRWALGAWSEETGWPGCVSFYRQRLCWGRTDTQPQTVWFTSAGFVSRFNTSSDALADESITITIVAGEVNEMQWLQESNDLVVGTSGAIRTVGPADTGKPFSGENLDQKRQSTVGTSRVLPVQVGPVTFFPGIYADSLREFLFSFQQNSYISPELSILSEHMLRSGIKQMAYQQEKDSIVWCAMGNGELVGITYERDQQIVAMTRHRLGGSYTQAKNSEPDSTEWGFVESVACIPGEDRHELWLSVLRTIAGRNVRYIERLSIPFEEMDKRDAFFVDAGMSFAQSGVGAGEVGDTVTHDALEDAEEDEGEAYSEALGLRARVFSGINWLRGQTVSMLVDGAREADTAVTSAGVLTIPSGRRGRRVTFGLPYTSRAKTLPIAQGSGDGSGLGRKRVVVQMNLGLLETGYLQVGTEGARELDVIYGTRGRSDEMNTSPPLYTGFKTTSNFDKRWDTYGQVIMETDRPLPATIRSITPIFDGEP